MSDTASDSLRERVAKMHDRALYVAENTGDYETVETCLAVLAILDTASDERRAKIERVMREVDEAAAAFNRAPYCEAVIDGMRSLDDARDAIEALRAGPRRGDGGASAHEGNPHADERGIPNRHRKTRRCAVGFRPSGPMATRDGRCRRVGASMTDLLLGHGNRGGRHSHYVVERKSRAPHACVDRVIRRAACGVKCHAFEVDDAGEASCPNCQRVKAAGRTILLSVLPTPPHPKGDSTR